MLKFRRRVQRSIIPALGYREVIWLLGDGRSGTTWASSLINASGNCRECFEPVHPAMVEKFAFLPRNTYVRPGETFPELDDALSEVFSGRFWHHWVDREEPRRAFVSSLLIKDIHANLLGAWAAARRPKVKPVLLLRHPLDVALSKLSLDDWPWMRRPSAFLDQPKLVADHLGPQAALLAEVDAEGDPLMNYVAIWAVLNAVPFRQFRKGQAHVLFYEDCVIDPQREMQALQAFLGRPSARIRLPDEVLSRPSFTSRTSDVSQKRGSPFGNWRARTSAAQIARAGEILAAFGLDTLYDPKGLPRREALSAFPIGGA